MKRLLPIATALATLALSACGYTLAGRGNTLPAHIKRIGIPTFQNHSATPELDRVISEAVRAEFSSKGRFLIVQDSTGVDAVLTGTMNPILMTVAAFTDANQAAKYNITVQAAVEFKDLTDNKVLFNNPSMRVTEEYSVTGTVAVNDPSALFSQDASALSRIAKTFARSLVSSILDSF